MSNNNLSKAHFETLLCEYPTLTTEGEGLPLTYGLNPQKDFAQKRKNLEDEFDGFVFFTEYILKMDSKDKWAMKGMSCFTVADYIRVETNTSYSDGAFILALRSLNVSLVKEDPNRTGLRICKDQPENSYLDKD